MVIKNGKGNAKVLPSSQQNEGECQLAIAGWNCGNHFTKVVLDGRDVVIPSYVAEGRNRVGESYPNTHLDDLDVKINDEPWFIGSLAEKYEDMKIAYEKFKYNELGTRACLLAATAYLEAVTTGNKNVSVNVQPVACLPIVDYREQKNDFAKFLTGIFKIQLPHQKVTIEVTNPTITPEGVCAAWDLYLDDQGQEISTYANKKIAIIDVGSRTTNVAVLNEMAFIPEQSDTIDVGSWDFNGEAIKQEVKPKMDVKPQHYYKHLHLVKDMTPYYARFVKSITSIIKQTCWKQNPNLDTIFLCGGDAKNLLPIFATYYDNVKVHPLDPMLANARGAYKLGVLKYRK